MLRGGAAFDSPRESSRFAALRGGPRRSGVPPVAVRDNPVQFAVVREDPAIERAVIDRTAARGALLVASGGCTVLSLAVERPGLSLTAFDANPAQIDLVRRKLGALREGLRDPELWSVGVDEGLNACGNFESLFRALRRFLEDLVVPREELLAAFEGRRDFAATARRLVTHRIWPVAFEAHFGDDLLREMFGQAAIQHAPPGSYPAHFRAAFERGLGRADARKNPFLQHLLLGHYVGAPAPGPEYLARPFTGADPELVHGTLTDVPDLERFDVISLSNVTDWMSREETVALARDLDERAAPGTFVIVRMLAASLPLADALGPAWRPDPELSRSLLARDRSLFYSDLLIAEKR